MQQPDLNSGVWVICWDRMNERRDDNPEKLVLTLEEARRIVQPVSQMDWMANAGYHARFAGGHRNPGFEVRKDGLRLNSGRTMGELRQALKGFEEEPKAEANDGQVWQMKVSLAGTISQACEMLRVLAIVGDADPGTPEMEDARRAMNRYFWTDGAMDVKDYAQDMQPAAMAFWLSGLHRHLEELRRQKPEQAGWFFSLWVE